MRFFRQPSLRARRPSRMRRFSPTLEALESRLVPYSVSGDMWPHPNLITISFVPDGTLLNGGASSNLFGQFNSHPGWTTATWQTQILEAAQAWAQQTNLNFALVPDNGAPEGSGSYQQGDPNIGDIRIGGYNMGTNVLAQAYMPPPDNNYSIAGDIDFNTGQPFNVGATYDLFSVALHEFGHALGMYGSSTISAAMYETYSGVKYGLTSDDVAGIQSIYSNGNPRTPDAYAGNQSFATAANLSLQINPLTQAALIPDLDLTSTNGSTGARTYTENDYFTFTAPLLTSNTLRVQVQSTGLSLLSPTVTVYAANQTTVLASASGANQYGATITATVNGVTPGEQFYVKVAGATTTLGSGKYALGVNFGTGAMPTEAPPNTQTANGSPLSSGGGQANKQSNEYQVNSTTNGTEQTFAQSPQAVAIDANGDYVATWSSAGQDGDGWGVYGQRFSADGTPQGGEFQVNTTTAGDQMYSSVAMDANGNFVITWSSYGQDGSGCGVYAQRYSADGTPQGGEFQVNATTAGDQMYSSVAMAPNGQFVITWSSNGQDGSGWGVFGQYYNAAGTPEGGEFQVNTTTTGDQTYSAAAMDANGDFAITWSSNGQDGSGWGVFAQRFSAPVLAPLAFLTGNLLGSSTTSFLSPTSQGGELQVNTTTLGNQQFSDVAMDASGDFAVTWSSNGQDGSGWGVYGQRYSADGTPQGGEFQVNTTTKGNQGLSRITMDAKGDFLISWSGSVQNSTATGIYGQQYNALGLPEGSEFQISTTQGNENYSAVAMDTLGDAVAVWTSTASGGTNAVLAQRYTVNGNDLSAGIADPLRITGDDGGPDGQDAGGTGDAPPTPAGLATPEDAAIPPRGIWILPGNAALAASGPLAPLATSAGFLAPSTPAPQTIAPPSSGELQPAPGLAGWDGGPGFSGTATSGPESPLPVSPAPSGQPGPAGETPAPGAALDAAQWEQATALYFAGPAGTVTDGNAWGDVPSDQGEAPAGWTL